MIKILCDRCNSELEDGDDNGDDNELHFTKERRTRFGYDKLLHLCNNCLKQFEEWIYKNEDVKK